MNNAINKIKQVSGKEINLDIIHYRLPLVIGAVVFFSVTIFYLLRSNAEPYSYVLGILAGLFTFCLICAFRKKSPSFIWNVLSVFCSIVAFGIIEYLGRNAYLKFEISLSFLQIILNLVWYWCAFGILLLVTRRRSLAMIVLLTFAMLIGNIEFYMMKFRGRVVLPMDFYAVRTAMNVTGSYDFTPEGQQWIAIAFYIFTVALLILMFKFRREQDRVKINVPKLIIGIAFPVVCIVLFFGTSMLTALGFQTSLWKTMWVTSDNGIVLNFMVNLKYSSISKPENYSATLANSLAKEQSDSVKDASFLPNVIVIMNEAFSDLSVIGVETSEDYLSFYHSMKEDAIKGNLHVSVFGGHTASSEYEFFTGNTMAFMPEYTVAYQMHVRENDYSIVNQFNDLGYQTIAMHPYLSSGWNRDAVYDYFGFDETYFIEDFESLSYIREYASDSSNYENLIRVFEEKKDEDPLFIFNITMQNHGYYYDKDVFENPVKTALANTDETAELILSLMRESDRAFEELIAYFKNVEEPTVIVLFGDHQPDLSIEFYANLFSENSDEFSYNVFESIYVVPYVIWANYDIQEEQDVDMSLNYLSAYLMDKLGLPMTGYGKFLLSTRQTIPFINGPFVSETGAEFLKDKDLLSEKAREALYKYEVIQYCAVVDRKNRPEEFFNLSE